MNPKIKEALQTGRAHKFSQLTNISTNEAFLIVKDYLTLNELIKKAVSEEKDTLELENQMDAYEAQVEQLVREYNQQKSR